MLLSIVVVFTSCKEKKNVVVFGETEWYKPWLWKKYTPVIMERTLELDFNEDAKYWLKDKPIRFELRTINDEPVENIKFYVNDELCENNKFEVSVDDKEVKLGIEFEESAEEGDHNYILKYLGNNSKNKLDVVAFDSFGYDNSITAKKKIVDNPAKVLCSWSIVSLIIAVVLWYIVSRFILWKSVPFSKILIDYNDGMGQKTVKMNGRYELVCTNNSKSKDSSLAKIFKGKKQYEVNSFWTHDLMISDGKRRKIKLQGLKNYSLEGQSVQKQPFVIINNKGNKVTIITT